MYSLYLVTVARVELHCFTLDDLNVVHELIDSNDNNMVKLNLHQNKLKTFHREYQNNQACRYGIVGYGFELCVDVAEYLNVRTNKLGNKMYWHQMGPDTMVNV